MLVGRLIRAARGGWPDRVSPIVKAALVAHYQRVSMLIVVHPNQAMRVAKKRHVNYMSLFTARFIKHKYPAFAIGCHDPRFGECPGQPDGIRIRDWSRWDVFRRLLVLEQTVECDLCSGTGYRGRLGIHELMEGSKQVKQLIKNQANTEDIFKQAIGEGMDTLKQDGIKKAFQGFTDIKEVRRVCIS